MSATPYRVSTMTYVCKFSNAIDTTTFYEANVETVIDDELYIENKQKKTNKKGVAVKSFGNQITFKSHVKKYNIKLFSNGKIQMTGIKSIEDTQHIQSKLQLIFETDIIGMEMVMMNVTFKISEQPIHLYHLFDTLAVQDLVVYYTPEIYPGLKLKYNKSTAMLFATGSIIISTKDQTDIDVITRILVENYLKIA